MSAFSHGFNHGFRFSMFNNMLANGWCNPFGGFGFGCSPFNAFNFGGSFFNNFGCGCNPFMGWNPSSMFMLPRYNFSVFTPYQSSSMMMPNPWTVNMPNITPAPISPIYNITAPNNLQIGDTFTSTTGATTTNTTIITSSEKTQTKTEEKDKVKLGNEADKTTKTQTTSTSETVTVKKADKTNNENQQATTQKFSSNISTLDNNNYNNLIVKYAEKYDVNPNLVKAMIKQESSFNPRAVSRAGAKGLMQLMPATASDLSVRNSFNPEENINGGVKLISKLIKRYKGNVELALAAYNAGPGNVKNGKIPQNGETPNYVKKVMKYYNEYKSA